MPACARSQIVIEDQVGVYHCIARCVRRAFLCGIDPYTGKDFSHRKEWILDRMRDLAGLFAIEVCGYTVMSNHVHLVLRTRPDIAAQWSADEIALRWCGLFPLRDETTGEPTEHDLAMITADSELLAERRKRLASLSWFMRCLCENIARAANDEDNTKGRFWAGRFKSVPLLDEAAILACSVYVDLNPIRAGLATTPEESPFTSGRDRIRSMIETSSTAPLPSDEEDRAAQACDRVDAWLCELTIHESAAEFACATVVGGASIPDESASRSGESATAATVAVDEVRPSADCSEIAGVGAPGEAPQRSRVRASNQGFLPISVEHYVMLLDWTGRELRADKRGAIPDHLAPVMDRLGLNQSNWLATVRGFGRLFKQAAGRSSSLLDAAARRSRRWFQGKAAAQMAFI